MYRQVDGSWAGRPTDEEIQEVRELVERGVLVEELDDRRAWIYSNWIVGMIFDDDR